MRHKNDMLKHFKEGPLYKLFQKFEVPYRVVDFLKLNKYKIRDMITDKERVKHWNDLLSVKHDVHSAFLHNNDNNMPLQGEATVENRWSSLCHSNDPQY